MKVYYEINGTKKKQEIYQEKNKRSQTKVKILSCDNKHKYAVKNKMS